MKDQLQGCESDRKMAEHPMMRVAVIGAGLSGLVTIKELVEENQTVICLEREDDIGGAFYAKEGKAGIYNQLHLTVSNYFMSFSSLQPKERLRRYWTAKEYWQYLNEFAEKYSLRDYIRFGCTVESITPIDPYTWAVVYSQNGKEKKEYVDSVAICQGKFSKPKIPELKDIKKFKGTIHHSYDYKSPEAYRDKEVVCVGIGESGSDIAHQIAKVSRSAHLITTRPKAMIPRFIFGDTNDAFSSRILHYSIALSNSYFDASLKGNLFRFLVRNRRKKISSKRVWSYLGRNGFEFRNKNDVFFQDIDNGKLMVHFFGIDRFCQDGIVLQDGTKIQCTDVMLSTGYQNQFDIIKHPAVKDVVRSFRNNLFHMIHPSLRESLVWIGFVRPDVGGVPTIAELQARFFAKLLAKKLTLPEHAKLRAKVNKLKKEEDFQFNDEPHLTENTRYYHMTDSIAKALGVKAKWYHVIFDPRLFLCYYLGSLVACQFRLVGPNSFKKRAKRFIKSVSLAGTSMKTRLMIYAAMALGSIPCAVLKIVAPWFEANQKVLSHKRYNSLEEILKHQWFKQAKKVDGMTEFRSIFGSAYEHEGFKYFLVDKYNIAPSNFSKQSLLVSDVNQLLNNVQCSGIRKPVNQSNEQTLDSLSAGIRG
ncbi:MAG: hypothetical protein NPIRA04_24770 [Nitrospirales bacterium]|nr:MAG: hypothetical protein NPIRA04_24770 [Nitrospirales bacterium]